MSVGLPVGEHFKMHEPWRLRLSYAYSYSDTDHYYLGEKREHDIEAAPDPATLVNDHTVTLQYDIPWKISLRAEVPFVYIRQSRASGGVAGTMESVGLSDLRLVAQYWVTDENPLFRFYVGLGTRVPTGESDEKFTAQNGTRISADVATQAGTGNAAGIVDFGATSQLSDLVGLFLEGRYIFTPAGQADSRNFRWELTGTGPRKNSDADAGTLRVGANFAVGSYIRKRSRDEPIQALDSFALQAIFDTAWVPHDDVIGSSGGFRRSAIILFVGPGITWAPYDNLTLTASTPIVVYRKVQRNGGNLPEWVFQTSATVTF